MAGLGTFLVAIAGPVVRKALTSIGIGIVSYAALSTALNTALSSAKGALGGFGGDAASIVQMSGVFDAMSIIAGALIARVALAQLKRLEILR